MCKNARTTTETEVVKKKKKLRLWDKIKQQIYFNTSHPRILSRKRQSIFIYCEEK